MFMRMSSTWVSLCQSLFVSLHQMAVARVYFAYENAFQTTDLRLRKSEQGLRIDLSESEAIWWHQILEDGGVAPVSRTQ